MPSSSVQPRTIADKWGISTVCFRHLDLAGALDEILSLGITAVDLAALRGLCEHVSPEGEPNLLRQARNVVKSSGVKALALNADPQSFDEQDQQLVLNRIERLVEFCADVECPLLILPCGSVSNRDNATSETVKVIADGLLAAAARAEGSGVTVSVEAPHYFRVCHGLEGMDELVARLHGQVPLVFDTSHVRATGADPASVFAQRRDDIVHVQIRDAVPGDIRRAIGRGDVNFGAFLAACVNAQYDGYYVLELETHDSPYATKKHEVAAALDFAQWLTTTTGELSTLGGTG